MVSHERDAFYIGKYKIGRKDFKTLEHPFVFPIRRYPG